MSTHKLSETNDRRQERVIIALPWPPTVNHYWRRVGNRTLISAEGRRYRHAVAGAVLEQRAARGYTGRLSVIIEVYPPDKRRRDMDNMLKAILDGLQAAGVYADDSQIDEICIRRREPDRSNGGHVDVYLWEVE